MAAETDTTSRTEPDIARELIRYLPRPGDIDRIGDLKTIQAICDEIRDFQKALGVPDLATRQARQLVAVTTGTDLEKDQSLIRCLGEHPEIATVKPEVFARLIQLSGALSSTDEASTRLALNLLQAVVEFDAGQQAECARLVKLVSLPPETQLTPGFTVGLAQVLLGSFMKTLLLQQPMKRTRHKVPPGPLAAPQAPVSATEAVGPITREVLPRANAGQILKGAFKLELLQGRVGVTATTVTEHTAVRGPAYDRKARALLQALVHDLTATDADLASETQELARALGVDPAAIQERLDRQQAAHQGFGHGWSVRTSARWGRRVVDGTRRLARAIAESDIARHRATLPAPAQARLDDDLKDYRQVQQADITRRVEEQRLLRGIAAAREQQQAEFADRIQLIETLSRLDLKEDVPWDELVRAGATLDRLTAQGEEPT